MKIWLFQKSEILGSLKDIKLMRTGQQYIELSRRGHEVIWITSDFDDHRKMKRTIPADAEWHQNQSRLLLLPRITYFKNRSFTRIWSDWNFGNNLGGELEKFADPDIGILSIPNIEFAFKVAKFLKSKSIPYIVDVRDLHPDHVRSLVPKFVRIFLEPYFQNLENKLKYIIKNAEHITALTDAYLTWSLEKIENSKSGTVLPMSVHLVDDKTQPLTKQGLENDDKALTRQRRILFFGTVGKNFDWKFLNIFVNHPNFELLIAGKGDELRSLQEKYETVAGNIKFLGFKNYSDLQSLAKRCDVAIAPYSNIRNFTENIPNKIIDYLAMGLPILVPHYCSSILSEFKDARFILPYSNYDDIIYYLREYDAQYMNELGSAAQGMVKKHYSSGSMSEQLLKIINRVLT